MEETGGSIILKQMLKKWDVRGVYCINWLRLYYSDGVFLSSLTTLEFHIKGKTGNGCHLLENNFILRICFTWIAGYG
jgi:hypothetical protein